MNPRYRNLMLDVEALALNSPQAAVIQVAAKPFDSLKDFTDEYLRHTPTAYHEAPSFNQRIWTQSYPRQGFVIEQGTIDWWNGQDEAMRKMAFSGMTDTEIVAQRFVDWINELQRSGILAQGKELRIWARNNQYDFPILKNWLEQCNQQWPFHHRSTREYYNEIDGVPEEAYAHITNNLWHDAACDVDHQIRVVQFCQNFWADRHAGVNP